VSANILKELMRDGIHQFGQLTGENLETYSRTWSALAEKMLNNPENTYTPEVRALIQAAKRSMNHLIMDIDRDGKGIHSSDTPEALAKLRTALAPFAESASEPLTKPDEKDRFHVAGKCQGKTYYWTRGLPQWGWSLHKDCSSTRDLITATAIGTSMRGQHLKWPGLYGPTVDEVFLISQKTGNVFPLPLSQPTES
jgi:hypothetical protein